MRKYAIVDEFLAYNNCNNNIHKLQLNLQRHFSSNYNSGNRRKDYGNYTVRDAKQNDLPSFSNLLRQLYLRSHPDLLRSTNPELADINDQSMQIVNGLLSTVKEYNQYPPQTILNIPFHVKNQATGIIHCHELRIRTAGGECKRQLTTTFEEFFIQSGIVSVDNNNYNNHYNRKNNKKRAAIFDWGKDYFPVQDKDLN
eukprot:gene4090-5838_t